MVNWRVGSSPPPKRSNRGRCFKHRYCNLPPLWLLSDNCITKVKEPFPGSARVNLSLVHSMKSWFIVPHFTSLTLQPVLLKLQNWKILFHVLGTTHKLNVVSVPPPYLQPFRLIPNLHLSQRLILIFVLNHKTFLISNLDCNAEQNICCTKTVLHFRALMRQCMFSLFFSTQADFPALQTWPAKGKRQAFSSWWAG